MKYHKAQNIACFSRDEIDLFYKSTKSEEFSNIINQRGLNVSDLAQNRGLLESVIDSMVENSGKDKDEVEIFVVAYMLLDFYEDSSECCFYMENGFNPEKNEIRNLVDLKKYIKESSLVDFLILSKAGFRAFQLKRYRGNPTTEDVFNFLVKKLNHYGRELGDVNVLLLLQTQKLDLTIDFEELHKKVDQLKLPFKGNILINFNEEDKYDVIVEIYPGLQSRKLPIVS